MPLFKDCYGTTVGSVFENQVKRIDLTVKESIIRDNLGHVHLGVSEIHGVTPIFVTGIGSSEDKIPLFTHPLAILNFNHKNYVCVDVRPFVRKDTPLDNVENNIKNVTEYNFVKNRAVLSTAWVAADYSVLKNSLQFAGTVFAAWLAETISKAHALDFKDRTTLAILSSFYYQSLFSEQTTFSEEDKQRMAVHTISATKAPASYVFEVFDKIPEIKNIEDFCRAARTITENVRLNDLTLPVLLTLVKNSWYGFQAKEILPIALEHPPTWMTIVYSALTERTYKNSMIYRVAEPFGKRGLADEFLKNFSLVMQGYQVRSDATGTVG
jgi:hypothetical protein